MSLQSSPLCTIVRKDVNGGVVECWEYRFRGDVELVRRSGELAWPREPEFRIRPSEKTAVEELEMLPRSLGTIALFELAGPLGKG